MLWFVCCLFLAFARRSVWISSILSIFNRQTHVIKWIVDVLADFIVYVLDFTTIIACDFGAAVCRHAANSSVCLSSGGHPLGIRIFFYMQSETVLPMQLEQLFEFVWLESKQNIVPQRRNEFYGHFLLAFVWKLKQQTFHASVYSNFI